ncbi:MAG: recombinase family protein [Eubacteriales bacterium]|nr:recombinase family protein [Eubacteriales bacterium]
MIRVASYCRVSTDKEDQANSFEAQVRYFGEYIQRKPDWVLADIYADEGITGTSTKKRTQFNRMMNDAYDGKFDLLITKEVSRFSRNILDTISYTRELKALGIHVVFMNDGFSTADPDSELRLSIMGSIAQEESRKTSTRVKWGQTRQMERGVVFGRSMLGYDVAGGRMTVNPEGAQLVRLIFQKYAVEKMGTTNLCRYLEEQGYETFSGNRHWSSSHLVKILKNEKYVGDLVQKKTYTPDYLTHEKKANQGQVEKVIFENHHEPIIDRPLWNLAQAELRKNDKHGDFPAIHSNKHLFSGLIRCGACGSGFVSRVKKAGDGTTYRRWSCAKAASGIAGCDVGRLLRDDDARNMVKLALQALQMDAQSIAANVAKLAAEAIQTGEGTAPDSPQRLNNEIEKWTNKKITALDSFLDGNLTKEELNLMKGKYDEEIAALQTRLATAEARQRAVSNPPQLREKIRALLSGEAESEPLYKSILDHISVFHDRHLELRFQGLPHVFQFSG